MSLHKHELKGCSPSPLANYLKALGILRLVSEQADSLARGCWEDEHFCLMTQLSATELETFLLVQYQPTPIISPWNKGSGFFKANDPGLAPIEASRASRFESFRRGISDARALLDSVAAADGVIRSIKARTKTNKSFQTKEQRSLLSKSDTYLQTKDLVLSLREKSGITSAEAASLDEEIKGLELLTTDTDRFATKAEANRLKANAGYKRLLAAADRNFKRLKASLIPNCRNLWRGPHANWISAAVVLDQDGTPYWPSLLGTGGNDGNLDFTNNLLQIIGELFDLTSEDGRPKRQTESLLRNSIWAVPTKEFATVAIGQFQPGNAGGANSSNGATGDSLVNLWDFLLMMEGSILFSSRSTRRLDPNASSRASAPFVLRSHASGYCSPGTEKSQRGEQWMPIWSRAAALSDVKCLIGEARIQLGRETANRPIDAVRAISRLGVARGIDSFVRYGYLERNGQSTLAVPLGRIVVRQNPNAYLIDDLAQWLDRIQRKARDKNAPSRLVHAERRLSDSVLEALAHDHTPERWREVLLSAVSIESIQATGTAIDIGPIPPLRPEWIHAIGFDSSPEARLAVALGSAANAYSAKGAAYDSVRHHFLPLMPGARQFNTSDKRLLKDPRVVVAGRDPVGDCIAIVQRRLVESAQRGERLCRLVSPNRCSACLSDIALLLEGQLDIQLTFDLARALMAAKWDEIEMNDNRMAHLSYGNAVSIPEAWFAIRLACLPWKLTNGVSIPAESSMVARLASGDGATASQIAINRLNASGVRPPLQSAITDPVTARLWAAALVFPIDRQSVNLMLSILDPKKKVKPNA